MSKNRLNIVSTGHKSHSESRPAVGKTSREEIQARFDRLWLQNPGLFDPSRNCMEAERIKRTSDLIQSIPLPAGFQAADLGSGKGTLSRLLVAAGSKVTAVDITQNALKNLRDIESANLTLAQDCLPHTKLDDKSFDLVLCTDLVAFLLPKEHRLFFSELVRVVKDEGYIVCSTPVDIYSDDALEKFAFLAETEIEVLKWKFSYHRLYIHLTDMLKAPANFAKARTNETYRHEAITSRKYFSKWWFQLNSSPLIGDFWRAAQYVINPIFHFVKHRRWILLVCEKITKALWNDAGISHAIFVGKRRPLFTPLPDAPPPIEQRQKKTVWE